MAMTKTNFASGHAPWDKADLFFLFNALARGMSIQDLAGFLNRSEDEVRRQAGSRCHESISSSLDVLPSERHRRSTDNKSVFSAGSRASSAKR
jgi:hypothetical protein